MLERSCFRRIQCFFIHFMRGKVDILSHPYAQKLISSIDSSSVDTDGVIIYPVLSMISRYGLSGRVKGLLLMAFESS